MTAIAVSPQWLEQHRQDPELVIVDCRFALNDSQLGRKQYQAGHIPGAYYLDLNQDLSSPVAKHGGRHPLPDPTGFATKLSQIGVTEKTLVVAYDDAQLAFAARLWWLLRWLGHDRGAVLDGGLTAYLAAGYPLTQALPAKRPGNFVPKLDPNQVVEIATVKATKNQPSIVLVDSREGDRYRGEQEPIDPIAGHIPGAVNYCWQDVTDANGKLRSSTELQAHWSKISNADQILVYCGSGVTACVNLFALAAAGIPSGKLYAGSWSDWCSYLS
ncbi:MAG: sulfurtransferase [Aphanocapsa sp. GSE-SYN-MK-11-07L]|jgi:thiosulfate/3-mercaptopyruvate sulfurtransferase|nr:sulfurtransferase [Aphanocapsa sp. GSE-SYN-MK-11-07L]